MSNKPEAPEVVSIRHLWVAYDDEIILEDVNLSVRERDFIGIIGPNGGGKTTLFKALLGLMPPLRGEIRIFGQDVKEGRRYVGYVPQLVEFDRDFPISVWDAPRMGRLSKRGPSRRYQAEDDDIVADALARVGMLALRRRAIGELSGGQRQRVYVARALASQPRLLLLDEPTANIDRPASDSIYELLARLNEQITIVMISHDTLAISASVKTVGCLNRRLVYHGSNEITSDMLAVGYECPVELIAHGLPHRVLAEHRPPGG